MDKNNDELFPCEFPIKVMGMVSADFDLLVVEIVRRHCQNLTEACVKKRTSSGGKYISVTVTFTAESRSQLDALYAELNQHEQIKMVL
jgi:putative lipoic acid-binding regulatory protein